MGYSTPLQTRYQVVVPAGATYLVVVNAVNSGATCPLYTLTVNEEVATPTPGIGTPSVTPTTTGTPRPCNLQFTDVPTTDPFYTPIHALACRGVINGYANANGTTYSFRPGNPATRAQMTKIVVLAFNVPIHTPTAGNTFRDVLRSDPFFTYVESAVSAQIISGYACGELCLEFRPGNSITRGQLSKIVTAAANWTLVNPSDRTFEDVLPGSTFYEVIETAVCHGVISGYACGAPGEPCNGPLNRPYFRPNNNATRGQIAKIVYNATLNLPGCPTAR